MEFWPSEASSSIARETTSSAEIAVKLETLTGTYIGFLRTLSAQGHVLINGYLWKSREALALVKRAAGDDAWLAASDGHDRFDALPLLVATDGAVAAFGRDVRRLRPNILIGAWMASPSATVRARSCTSAA